MAGIDLSKIQPAVLGDMRRRMDAAADAVLAEAVGELADNQQTGALAASGRVDADGDDRLTVVFEDASAAPMEFGNSRQAAHPFLLPSLRRVTR